MDRGFNKRKVFKALLGYRHHILCRAKSNSVFYRLPKPQEQPKRGRKRKYGKRLFIPKMKFQDMETQGKVASVAHAIVRTKVCPEIVRLVVIRTKPRKSKPYRYFMVYTTNLELPVETIIHYYRLRWQLETAFRDTKQNLGFHEYQVRSYSSISRFVQLSFTAASIMQLLFHQCIPMVNVDEVCNALGIHWYRPSKITRGLMKAYLRYQKMQQLFSEFMVTLPKTPKIQKTMAKAA